MFDDSGAAELFPGEAPSTHNGSCEPQQWDSLPPPPTSYRKQGRHVAGQRPRRRRQTFGSHVFSTPPAFILSQDQTLHYFSLPCLPVWPDQHGTCAPAPQGKPVGRWHTTSERALQRSTTTPTAAAAAADPSSSHASHTGFARALTGLTKGSLSAIRSIAAAGAPAATVTAHAAPPNTTGGPVPEPAASLAATNLTTGSGARVAGLLPQCTSPQKKNSLTILLQVLELFIQLYGPALVLLENMHEFDTWSWQLLLKVAEMLSSSCLVVATTRPNEPPVSSASSNHHLHGKAALHFKVALMYRHLLQLGSTTRILLQPFGFHQTKALMQLVADNNYPDQYVIAVMEKTGGMPMYIEKVTEFLSQKPWLAEHGGGEFAANVNMTIKSLNFQQVIIERMDRLKPPIQLALKVSSVMGQWVDLDILHRFFPIKKSREELRGYLLELERGSFLKPTDTEGVWEVNMVERDIVYEVLPHFQRRRMHAQLAQELEQMHEEEEEAGGGGGEGGGVQVATLTTIAYHWNQACMGHEVTEVECALKAIEFWHSAAHAAYGSSSLMEALRLYQKAAQIAEVLSENLGESMRLQRERNSHSHEPGGGGVGDEPGTTSFSAVGSAYRGPRNWGLISLLSRAQWERSMASCCLGIVLQHRYESNSQMQHWDNEDNYFTLLTEHAIRGLMLLGSPHPRDLLQPHAGGRGRAVVALLAVCCGVDGSGLSGVKEGVVLRQEEVSEIRDILLVLIIAADHYSLTHDGQQYTRLLTFCKRVCKFFDRCCADTAVDPFLDISVAAAARVKAFRSNVALQTQADFGFTGPNADITTAVGAHRGGMRDMRWARVDEQGREMARG
ncbi:MAG: hypothetical protein WDW36_005729 [Sanguina aurantia]